MNKKFISLFLLALALASTAMPMGRHLTALHIAAQKGDLELVRTLIKNGANVNAEEVSRCTPLHDTIHLDNTECAEELLNKGANVNAQNISGRTPLHYAAACGKIEHIKLLLQHKANVNIAEDTDEGWTPLHYAAFYNHLKCVELLLHNNANIAAINHTKKTPEDLARQEGHLEIADYLKTERKHREKEKEIIAETKVN